MNIFKRFSKYYNPPGTGLIKDPRPVEEKGKDYEVKEVLMAAPVVWRPKTPEEWIKFLIYDQDGSGSCGMQTMAKLLGIENVREENKFVEYSRRDGYSQRRNSGPGMWMQDGFHIVYKKGLTLEQLMPSHKMNEAEMNDDSDRKTIDRQIALVGRAGGYVQSRVIDFNLIANAIALGKGVALACYFNSGDWNNGEVINRENGKFGHLVAGVDYCLWKGKRGIAFDNSWTEHWGFNGQGVITEDQPIRAWGFLKDLENIWRDKEGKEIPKPQYRWDRDLGYRMDNLEVSYLQRALMYEECFPIDTPATGYYGNITAKAVILFQRKYNVAPEEELVALQGRKVGPKTRKKLNEIFG